MCTSGYLILRKDAFLPIQNTWCYRAIRYETFEDASADLRQGDFLVETGREWTSSVLPVPIV